MATKSQKNKIASKAKETEPDFESESLPDKINTPSDIGDPLEKAPIVSHHENEGTLLQILSKLSKHSVVVLIVTALAVGTHFLLVHVFGDPKFFDLIPVRYVIDLGDIAIIFTFVIIVIRELWNLGRK